VLSVISVGASQMTSYAL